MYEELDIITLANTLSGKFGFTIYDVKKNRFYVVRDHIGIIPVYIGRGINGEFYVCSELKGPMIASGYLSGNGAIKPFSDDGWFESSFFKLT